MSRTPPPAAQVRGLSMRYGSTQALDNLTVTFAQGAISAVLGRNGAGKTTLIETCVGYRRPQAGEVRVLGLDPAADHRELLPRIGVMLQEGGCWSGVRAREMLQFAAKLYATPQDIDLLWSSLDLQECGTTPYRRLSGGLKQRLSLALALIGRPELVFVDEPTTGLDPHIRRQVWSLLQQLRNDGVSVVLTTHYLEEAERLADEVFVIDQGRLLAHGTAKSLAKPGESLEAAFLRLTERAS